MIQSLIHKIVQTKRIITTDQIDLAARGAYELYRKACHRYNVAMRLYQNKETTPRLNKVLAERDAVGLYAEQLDSLLAACFDIVEFQEYITPNNDVLYYAHYKFKDHEYLMGIKTDYVFAHKNIPIHKVTDVKPIYPEAVNIASYSFVNRTLRILGDRRRADPDFAILDNGTYKLDDPNYVPDFPLLPTDLLDKREMELKFYVNNNVMILNF